MTVPDHRELVSALLAVEGVADAAVEPDGHEPATLRLQLVPGVDELAVTGEVNRLLRSRFGLAVDADDVRVLSEPASGSGQSPARKQSGPVIRGVSSAGPSTHLRVVRPGRLTIQRVQLISSGLGVVVTVSLALGDRGFDGQAEGSATPTGIHRAVAAATLRAVEAVVEKRARFEVEHVELAASGDDRTALAVVTMLTGRGIDRLSGASVIRDDVRQAVIRAVLAAINRRLEPMLDDL